MRNDMLKRLSNRGEAYLHALLAPAVARHNAETYRKVRIADVVDIKHLTSPALRRFALMGHFDFVITDCNHDPQFAIEFDGGGHSDKNDHLKDEICQHVHLALFRLTAGCSRVKIREASFVAYLVDVWFYGHEFARMQAAGQLEYDEPFMMSGFLKHNAKNIFDSEFFYVLNAMARLRKLLNTGDPLEHLNASSISMIGPVGQYAAFAQHGNFRGSYGIAIRAVEWGDFDNFPAARELSEFCHALAYHDLCEDIKACRSEPPLPRPVIDIPKELACLRSRGFSLVLGFQTPDGWY